MTNDCADSFADLTCPQTGNSLRLEPIAGTDAGLLIGGGIPYPMIHGIPRLIDDGARKALVALLRIGDLDRASAIALSWPDRALGNRVRRKAGTALLRVAPGHPAVQRLASALSTGRSLRDDHASVEAMLRHLRSGLFADWILHRFSARTFRPLMALSRLVRPGDRVLDVGGGFGHGAWTLSNHVAPDRITLVDSVFSHLHVARKRMVPGIRAVAADVNQGLPFVGPAFDTIVMSDTFHFVPDPHRLAAEVDRLLTADGRLILSQLHNGLIPAEYAGHPRSPAGYLDLFPNLNPVMLDNADILQTLRTGAPLAIRRPFDLDTLAHTAEISLVADRTGDLTADYPDPNLSCRNPRIASILSNGPDGRLRSRDDLGPVLSAFIDWPDAETLGDATRDDLYRAIQSGGEALKTAWRAGLVVDTPPDYFDQG
ncbi:MAG: methyltransferase domain-containing protein [Jannaschia sp.]